MAFQREIVHGVRRGSTLILPPDQIPPGQLRLLRNMRLTRAPGQVSTRPGMTAVGTMGTGPVRSIMTFFGLNNANRRYVHAAGTLYRTSYTWSSPTVLTSPGTTPMSGRSMVDGEGGLSMYLSNSAVRGRDTGTTFWPWGIAAPTQAVGAPTLATDLSTVIDDMENAANWTVTAGLTAGPTNNTTYVQVGTTSQTITIAAATFGSIAKSLGATVDLSTLGGDDAVAADDYIHLWVRPDIPARVEYVQIDIDLDTTTVANAFRSNFYSIQLPGQAWLNQGRGQWSKLQVPKSAFARAGTDTALSWATAKSVRIGVMTTTAGACQLWLDDFKLRGGTDIVGSVRYAVCYRNSVTGARGNPYLSSTNQVVYSPAVTADRHRILVPLTNVTEGGAGHPGETQTNQIRVYRSLDGATGVEIAERVDTATATMTDSTSLASTVLAALIETDNHLPPAGKYVFGPGSLNRLFMLVGDSTLAYSKAWEIHENRVENWPLEFRLTIGDGSERAHAGIVADNTVIVWTEQRTYLVQGSGEETFLPYPVPNSRGVVGPQAVTEGDGRVFFVSQDGIYEQVGLRQVRLTDSIAPFFEGQTVLEIPGFTRTLAQQQDTVLRWDADAFGPFLVCLYAEVGSPTLNRELYLGRNAETGQYTDISFDSRATPITALGVDVEQNRLYGGDANGVIYWVEAHATDTDDGAAIAWRMLTPSHHQGAPQRDKYYAQAIVALASQGQPTQCTIWYDKQTVPQVFAPVATTTAVGSVALALPTPTTLYQDIAIELSGSATTRVDIVQYGWFYEVQPEWLTFWDSGQLDFGAQTVLQGLWYTIMSFGNCTITIAMNVGAETVYTVVNTAGVRRADRLFFQAGTTGRLGRLTITCAEGMRIYALALHAKPYGQAQGYQPLPLLGTAVPAPA